jgi:RNA polymerase sigma-70 factor (ECF subfamily)
VSYTGGFGAVADVGTDRDEALVDALRLREPTAAERLVARYGDRAYRLAVRITGNAEDAEEVVQDAILSVVRKIDTFRGESAFGSWFYRIVSNAAYGHRRRPGASIEIPLEEVLSAFDEHGRRASLFRDWSSSVDDPAVQKQLRDVLTSAIDELPPHYRAAIVLRDVEGLSTAEVADALEIPVQTAKTHAYRARLLLRKRLSTFMEIERPFETEVHHQKADVRSIF